MVDKFKKIAEELVTTKGLIRLFAVMQMDDITDKWNVIVSAPWADEDSLETFKFVLETIKKYLSMEESSLMARLVLLKKDEHLVEELLKYKAGAVIENQRVNGNMVHFADVIVSDETVE